MAYSREESRENKQLATLGGGCFWCLEAAFLEIKGVEKVESGYSGGRTIKPSYDQVCNGTTGHAEVVQLTFDPKAISFQEIFRIFFTIHDPTTLNRQGADVGTQYRSIILYHNDEQKMIASKVIKEFETSDAWNKTIVTQIVPFESFYKAEEYHQDYYNRNPAQPYCQIVISPKIAKLRKYYSEKLKAKN